MPKQILYSNFSGTALFKWGKNDLPKIVKVLKLKNSENNNSLIRSYYTHFTQPYTSKATFFENGRVNITGAHSYESMQGILAQCIFAKLIQKLSEVEIIVIDELIVTNSTASFQLSYQIDIPKLQCQIQAQFGIQSKGNYAYLPKQVHKIQDVSVFLVKKKVKITKVHLIKDIQVFCIYLEYVLRPFELLNNKKINVDKETKQIRKQLKKLRQTEGINDSNGTITKQRQNRNKKSALQIDKIAKYRFQDDFFEQEDINQEDII